MSISIFMWDLTSCDLDFKEVKSIHIFIVVKRFMVTKSSVMEIQNLVVNHRSRPIKLNTEVRGIPRVPQV